MHGDEFFLQNARGTDATEAVLHPTERNLEVHQRHETCDAENQQIFCKQISEDRVTISRALR